MKYYWAFLVILWVFCINYAPSTTAQTDRPLNDYPIITADNVSQLEQLKVLGEGYIRQVIFSPDEQLVAMATSVGIWLYSADDLQNPIRLFGDYEIDVTYVMFNADGSRLFGGVQGGSVYIWDVASGELLIALEDVNDKYRDNPVIDIQLSDDEQQLYMMTKGYLTIWDLPSQTIIKSIQIYDPNTFNNGYERKNYHLLSPNKKFILKFEIFWVVLDNGDYLDTRTTIINIETEESYLLQSDDFVYSPHFDDTSEKIIAELTHHAIGVWDVYSGKLLFYVGELGYGYKGMAYTKPPQYHYDIRVPSPKVGIITKDQSKLITLGGTIWDIATNTILHQFSVEPTFILGDSQFIPHENIVFTYTTDEDELMRLLQEENVIQQIPIYFRLSMDRGIPDKPHGFVDISPQYKHLLFLSESILRIWDTETGELTIINFAESCSANEPFYESVRLSLNNTRAITYASDEENNLAYICIWNSENQELLYIADYLVGFQYQNELDDQHFIAGNRRTQIPTQIWDLATDTFIESSPNIISASTSVFSPTGHYLLISVGAISDKAKILDTQTGLVIQEIQHERVFYYAFFSPDESKLALVFGPYINDEYTSDVYVWDTESWSLMYQLDIPIGVAKIIFSPNGQYLLTQEDNQVRVWDSQTGQLIYTLSAEQFHVDRISYPVATFNYDGTQFAILYSTFSYGSSQTHLSIRETQSGGSIFALRSEDNINNRISFVDFSPANNLLMVVFADGLIQFWDTNTGELVHTMPTESFYGGKFTFNDTGNLILAEMQDGTIRIWGINAD